MSKARLTRRLVRPVADFALGLALFGALVASGVVDWSTPGGLIAGSAHAGWLEEIPKAIAGIERAVELAGTRIEPAASTLHHWLTVMSLALAFASMFAVNMWFIRHLRRVRTGSRSRR